MTTIKLFEFTPTSSARVRWTLIEAGLDYESVGNDPSVFGHPELRAVHPLGKVPAVLIDDRPLFESAAICAAIADLVPEKELIAKPETWSRSLHDQWSYFVMTDMEGYLRPNLNNLFLLPEEQRITAGLAQNEGMVKRAAAALDQVLAETDYLVDNQFSVTDIIASYTINTARRVGYLAGFDNLQTYLERLFARPHCTLDQS